MNYYTKEVSKEFYDKCKKENEGKDIVPFKFRPEIFTAAELCGYGIYGARLYEKDEKYYVYYTMGSSCD